MNSKIQVLLITNCKKYDQNSIFSPTAGLFRAKNKKKLNFPTFSTAFYTILFMAFVHLLLSEAAFVCRAAFDQVYRPTFPLMPSDHWNFTVFPYDPGRR
jgi:hypothetical protein